MEEQKETLTHGHSGGHTHATDDVLTLRTVVGNPNSVATGSKEGRGKKKPPQNFSM